MGEKIVVRRDCGVEQGGTLLDLYDRPDSHFMAGVTGPPAINLISAKNSSSTEWLDPGEKAGLPIAQGHGLKAGGDVLVGLRSEKLQVAQLDDSSAIPAEVHRVKTTRSDITVLCDTALGKLSILSKDRSTLCRGERIGVRTTGDATLLFEPKIERRVPVSSEGV